MRRWTDLLSVYAWCFKDDFPVGDGHSKRYGVLVIKCRRASERDGKRMFARVCFPCLTGCLVYLSSMKELVLSAWHIGCVDIDERR